jgi:hypothetical protein
LEGTAYVAPQVLVDVNHSKFMLEATDRYVALIHQNSNGRDGGS